MKVLASLLIIGGLISIAMGILWKFTGVMVVPLRTHGYFIFANTCLLLAIVCNTLKK